MQAPRRCGVRDRVEVLAPAAVALTGLVFVVLYSVALTSVSGASRRTTPREWEAIKAAAMRGCRKEQPVPADYGTCRWRGRVLVSTANRRYAWASVTGPSYDNSGVLRRPTMPTLADDSCRRRGNLAMLVLVAGDAARSRPRSEDPRVHRGIRRLQLPPMLSARVRPFPRPRGTAKSPGVFDVSARGVACPVSVVACCAAAPGAGFPSANPRRQC